MGRSRGLRLLANSGVLYLHVPAHTRVHISFSQSFSSSLHATQPVRTPARIIHVRGQGMRVHTSDSHKERSPSGAAISIPREGKLSQAKRERYLRKRKSLSLSPSLFPRCRGIVVTAIASERGSRKRTEMQFTDASTLTTTLLHGLSPSARESTSSIDRSRKTRPIDFTKRNALWFHRSNGGILSCRSDEFLSFSALPLLSTSPLPCHERDHEGVAIATSSFSLSSRDSLSFRLSSSLDSLCPASGLASGSRQRLH